jgi:hypothetical protein
MMKDLSTQRCFNHAQREAVARCPQCRGYFCRECITEHDSRVICAACLRKLVRKSALPRRTLTSLVQAGQCLLGIVVVWFFFHLIGEGLLSLPTSFHEGTLWEIKWWDEE